MATLQQMSNSSELALRGTKYGGPYLWQQSLPAIGVPTLSLDTKPVSGSARPGHVFCAKAPLSNVDSALTRSHIGHHYTR